MAKMTGAGISECAHLLVKPMGSIPRVPPSPLYCPPPGQTGFGCSRQAGERVREESEKSQRESQKVRESERDLIHPGVPASVDSSPSESLLPSAAPPPLPLSFNDGYLWQTAVSVYYE